MIGVIRRYVNLCLYLAFRVLLSVQLNMVVYYPIIAQLP